MAGTYKLIQAQILSSSQSSVTFSSIPATYTDLVLRTSLRVDSATTRTGAKLTLNSITTGYTETYLINYDSTAGSGSYTGNAFFWNEYIDGASATASTFSSGELYIPNYAGATNKPMSLYSVAEGNSATGYGAYTKAMLSSNVAAITGITLAGNSTAQFVAGSSFYLYGIEIPAQQITPKATGGDITYDASYVYHTFRQSGTFTPTQSLTADYLVVAGGGGGGGGAGGNKGGGGGGAGGLRTSIGGSALSLTAQAYTVTVGAGGPNGTSGVSGTNGSNSVFSTITSIGGGYGGAGVIGGNGGSGGGSGGAAGTFSVGQGTSGQGNNGGGQYGANGGAGGGGAGAVGAGALYTAGGAGGSGSTNSITGTSTYYAGGGGGAGEGYYDTGAAGGAGGGGDGEAGTNSINGTANLGGGGGGGNWNRTKNGGSGGSGIVIVRYAI